MKIIKNSTLIILKKGQHLKIAPQNKLFLKPAGKPIGEKIARGGPFVMNTKKEICVAVSRLSKWSLLCK